MTIELGILITLIGAVFGGGMTWGIFKNKLNGMTKEIETKQDANVCTELHKALFVRLDDLVDMVHLQTTDIKMITKSVIVLEEMAKNMRKRNGDS